MANTKQAKKMIRKTKANTTYNRWWKGKVKDAYKAFVNAVSSTQTEEKVSKMKDLQKTIDKATKNGVMKKNKANRMKSMAAKKIA